MNAPAATTPEVVVDESERRRQWGGGAEGAQHKHGAQVRVVEGVRCEAAGRAIGGTQSRSAALRKHVSRPGFVGRSASLVQWVGLTYSASW